MRLITLVVTFLLRMCHAHRAQMRSQRMHRKPHKECRGIDDTSVTSPTFSATRSNGLHRDGRIELPKPLRVLAAFLTSDPVAAFKPPVSGLFSTPPGLLPVVSALRHAACIHARLINNDMQEDAACELASDLNFELSPPPLAASHIKSRRYAAADWFKNLRTLPSSVILRRISSPLLANAFVTFLACFWHTRVAPLPTCVELPHKLLGIFLGLLLVFRTNKAYDRFWEARKVWGRVVNECRAFASLACTFLSPAQAEPILSLLNAFPVVMRNYILGKRGTRKLKRLLVRQELDALSIAASQPLYVLSRLRQLSQASSRLGVVEKEREMLLKCATVLERCMSTFERIYDTPIPISYSCHTSRFLMLYVSTLPFALVHALGWETLPVMTMITWALFGILEIGNMIEEPFRAVNHRPLLPQSEICMTIQRDVREIADFSQVAKNHSVPTIDPNPTEAALENFERAPVF
mmetsp:Transcript_31024/g.56383  ORF Transcript_31024/g.56383 Transcript_31024/m.56383 type:complete len:465 (+) Transcript_31024:82-1476(+)